jgi:hypothetical protein
MEPVNSQNDTISNYLNLMLEYVEHSYRPHLMGSHGPNQFVGHGAILRNFKTYEEKIEMSFFKKKYGIRVDKNGHKLRLKNYKLLNKIGFKEYIVKENSRCYLHLSKVPYCLSNSKRKCRQINPYFLEIQVIGIRHNQLIPWRFGEKEVKPYPYDLRLHYNCLTSTVTDHTLGERDMRQKGRKLICIEFFDGYYPINETGGSFPVLNYIKQRCKFLSDGETFEYPICLIFDKSPKKKFTRNIQGNRYNLLSRTKVVSPCFKRNCKKYYFIGR